MFNKLKYNLYSLKRDTLILKGLNEGTIVPFPDDFYNGMKTTYFNGIPIYMHMKYLKPTIQPGKCYDRSLFMFWCYKDSVRVIADDLELELHYGKDHAEHSWIELDNYVYDPSTLLRYDKDLYYEIYRPTNISKETVSDYNKRTGNLYESSITRDIKDLLPNGKNRAMLINQIPLVYGIAHNENNKEFIKDLEDYLKEIEYDEEEIYNEMITKFNELIKTKKLKL